MKFRALALGATIGFLAAVVPSCGKASNCGPSNCTGCCSSTGTCVTGTNGNNTTCGTSGNTCQDCTKTSQSCTSSFTCGGAGGAGGGTGGGTGGSGGNGNCNATNCANGCCNSGICIPATATAQSATNCGTGGQTCMMCPSGNVCRTGRCQFQDAGMPSVTGEACADDTACTSLGSMSKCKKTTTLGNGTYTGGYCSRQPCAATTAPCADDATCTNVPASLGETSALCLKKCVPGGTDCRAGYTCYPLTSGGGGVCFLDQTNLPTDVDAGPPADKVGNTCTANTDCQNPPAPPFQNLGFCGTETIADGGLTGFNGGYCLADCTDFGDQLCGANGVCLGVSQTDDTSWCFKSCTTPNAGQGACRTGYVCDSLFFNDGGMAPEGYCNPACGTPGNTCNAGFTCDGGYCVR